MKVQRVERLVVLMGLALGFITTGCLNREVAPAEPSTQSGVLEEIRQTGTTKVDILFVVDNSNSMSEEQVVLADQIVIMARELISPSDANAPTVEDMHIGIVTTDMGTGGYQIQTCTDSLAGDNGVLQNFGGPAGCAERYTAGDCDRAECPWLSHSVENPDNNEGDPANPPIWDDFGCVATLGTGGCGFEQQLEASYVALTVQSGPGMPNEGFVRNDSLLAIIYVTDEDDCSTGNQEMFNPSRDDYGSLNVRCALNPDELYPIERYHDAFLDLRGGDLNRIVVAAITGVPIDGSWDPGDPIQQLRDLQIVNPSNPNELQKSCDTAMGAAYPPVRIAELVYAFENNGVLESICRSDWTPALTAITRMIQDKLGGVCVGRPLASTDHEACTVIETLPDAGDCPDEANVAGPERSSGWRVDRGTIFVEQNGETVERRRCEILPADYDGDSCPDGSPVCPPDADDFPDGLQGWFYDTTNEDCQFGQVRFTRADVTEDLSDVRFECLTALCPERRSLCVRGETCNVGAECSGDNDCNGGVCVRHNSGEICGWEMVINPETGQEEPRGQTCQRCSQTLGQVCSKVRDTYPAEVHSEPIVGAGGCCAENFHNDGGECVPDRTFKDECN